MCFTQFLDPKLQDMQTFVLLVEKETYWCMHNKAHLVTKIILDWAVERRY